ncbi:MAG: Gfo/Idh/MocA family protein [Ferruginibacter sp.]
MKLRFAIIGCGRIAERHIAQAVRTGVVTAVCDIIPEKALTWSKALSCPAFQSLDELLTNPETFDWAVICTPNGWHAQQSIACLEAGKNVLVEKPMCLAESDAHRMKAAAEKAGKSLVVVKQNRFNPPVMWLRNSLHQGAFGQLQGFQMNALWHRPPSYFQESDWRGTLSMDGGALYTQFSHFIDLLIWLFGMPETVGGTCSNQYHPTIETEDHGIIWMNMKNNLTGSFHYSLNTYRENLEGSLLVWGTDGQCKIGGQYLNKLVYAETRKEGAITPLLAAVPSNDYGTYKGSMSNHDKVYDELLLKHTDKPHQLPAMDESIQPIALIENIYSIIRP